MKYFKTDVEKLNEDHLISVHHEDDDTVYFFKDVEDNKRFVFIEEIDKDYFFEIVGYKKDNEIYVHKMRFNDKRNTPVDLFCETYKIDINEGEFEWLYDEKFDCDMIIMKDEIVSENLVMIEK